MIRNRSCKWRRCRCWRHHGFEEAERRKLLPRTRLSNVQFGNDGYVSHRTNLRVDTHCLGGRQLYLNLAFGFKLCRAHHIHHPVLLCHRHKARTCTAWSVVALGARSAAVPRLRLQCRCRCGQPATQSSPRPVKKLLIADNALLVTAHIDCCFLHFRISHLALPHPSYRPCIMYWY
jgi:hypothetical protein